MTSFISKLQNTLYPAPFIPRLQEKVDETYSFWRWRIFYAMFIGYAFYYFTRQSLSYAMPALIRDLGFDKAQLGILSSILSISYGLSKFASGILCDRSNPRYFMAYGLILTGICNIFFGCASTLLFFALFWGLNGYFQGFGWPACARLLTHWYSRSERGRWWSTWSISQNVGGALIPLLAATVAQYFGWRFAMIVPGSMAIMGGLFLIYRLGDTPQSVGLPPIEEHRNDYPPQTHIERGVEERNLTIKEALFDYVLSNPYIWLLACSYFFVYVIRTGINVWAVLYLTDKGYSPIGAGSVVFWFEIGGLLGSLLAGWASDKIWKGARGPVNVIYAALTCVAIFSFWGFSGQQQLLDSVLIFSIGFFLFGPQMLIGMAAAELSHKKAAATATGLTGWIAYLGAAVAGYPLGIITQNWGWEGFFIALTACALIATLFLIPLWGAVSSEKKPALSQAKAS